MNKLRPKLPPLEWIRAFEAAARAGSFTAAADEIGITQSAVSQRIGNLEKHFGTALFHRHARSVSLTIEGEAWLPHVKNSLESMRESSEALFGGGSGQLVFSASQSIIGLWLLPRLEQVGQVCDGQVAIRSMVTGSYDMPADDVIRVRYGTGDWPIPYKAPIYAEKIAPMASPELARNAGHWTQWQRIACSGPRPEWQQWVAAYGVPSTPVPEFRFDTFLSAFEAAKAGLGVLLGSVPLCQPALDTGDLVLLDSRVLDHHETYWLLAGKDAVSRQQWDEIATVICKS